MGNYFKVNTLECTFALFSLTILTTSGGPKGLKKTIESSYTNLSSRFTFKNKYFGHFLFLCFFPVISYYLKLPFELADRL